MENSLIVVLTFKTQVFKGLTAHLLFSSRECSSLVCSWLVQYTVVFIEPIDIIHALLRNIATRFLTSDFSSCFTKILEFLWDVGFFKEQLEIKIKINFCFPSLVCPKG